MPRQILWALSRSLSSYPRIYTRTGDKGRSSLYTGERRPKYDLIFEALGTTDELSSHLGLAHVWATEQNHPYADHLQRIQCLLQDIGSSIAGGSRTPPFNPRHVLELEEWIDGFSNQLPPLNNFILPGGGKAGSTLHIARSVCRRAERRVCELVEQQQIEPEPLRYLNRLSDYLFTVARYAAKLDRMEETTYIQPEIELNKYESGPDGLWKRKK